MSPAVRTAQPARASLRAPAGRSHRWQRWQRGIGSAARPLDKAVQPLRGPAEEEGVAALLPDWRLIVGCCLCARLCAGEQAGFGARITAPQPAQTRVRRRCRPAHSRRAIAAAGIPPAAGIVGAAGRRLNTPPRPRRIVCSRPKKCGELLGVPSTRPSFLCRSNVSSANRRSHSRTYRLDSNESMVLPPVRRQRVFSPRRAMLGRSP